MLEASQQAIAFSKDHFRSAISCALQIVGAEPLKTSHSEPGGGQCIFPAMDQREGADPTWAETMDSLRTPRPRDQKLWEWRRIRGTATARLDCAFSKLHAGWDCSKGLLFCAKRLHRIDTRCMMGREPTCDNGNRNDSDEAERDCHRVHRLGFIQQAAE